MPLVLYRKVVILGYRSIVGSRSWGKHRRFVTRGGALLRERDPGRMVAPLDWECRARIERMEEEGRVVVVCGGLQEVGARKG